MAKTRQKPDLLQGTHDLLILRALQWGPQHGDGVGVALRASSDEVLNVDHGSLYPALHRLERQGWVDGEWKRSDNNQRAKYYRNTAATRLGSASCRRTILGHLAFASSQAEVSRRKWPTSEDRVASRSV